MVAMTALLTLLAYCAVSMDVMRASYVRLWGPETVSKFDTWQGLIATLVNTDDSNRIRKVNDFFNRKVLFADSIDIWHDKDYWPTPAETLGKGMANCTGYALAKYYSLRLAGMDSAKLRLVYVRAQSGGASSTTPPVAHMVVAYYPQPDSEPLILDNLIADVRPASRRPDLKPVFSFSEAGIYEGVVDATSGPVANTSRYSKWEAYLNKATEQGFR
jgi:predicted transglutaminase-like cysteine proteinase